MTLKWTQLQLNALGDDKYKNVIIDVLQGISNQDYAIETHTELQSLICGDPKQFENWGDAAADYFMEARCNVKPLSAPILLEILAHHLNIDEQNDLLSAAMVAAVLAEMPNATPFHNNHHFHEVIAVTVRLAIYHNMICKDETLGLINPNDILLMFIAACIHDFAHDGKGNFLDGMHISSRLELRSLGRAMPYLRQAGLDESNIQKIELMVICTDVSRGFVGQSPNGIMRDIYQAHGNDLISVVNVDEFYTPLVDDPKLSVMCMILAEADISLSSGLNYDFAKKMTILIAQESSVLKPSATTLHGFLETICHGRFYSDAAKKLLGDNFLSVYSDATKDKNKDVLYATPQAKGTVTHINR